MAMSTQRLVIITIILNVFLTIFLGVYQNIDSTDREQMNLEETNLQEKLNFYNDEYGDSLPDPDNYLESASFGDQKGSQSMLWSILRDGLNPFPEADAISNPVERWIQKGIRWFRILMGILLIIEIVFIFYNKKSS